MSPRTKTLYSRVTVISLLLTFAVSVLVIAFTWTSVTSSAKDIPIVVSGPASQVEAVTNALDVNASGTFLFAKVDSRDAAVRLIEDRTALGAIVLGGTPEVLVTSAGSPVVSQLLTTVAMQLGQQAGTQVTVTDIVPLASTDIRGAGLAVISFPLTIMGLLGGTIFSLLVAGTHQRIVGVVLYSVISAIAVVGVVQGLLQILQGSFVNNVAGLSLSTLGASAFIVGLHSLLGQKGIAIGAATTMLIANPISAAAQPEQFLVEPWGAIGQWLVPGASATLVRNLSYFPDAAAGFAWAILAAWALLGLTLTVVGGRLHNASSTVRELSGVNKTISS